MLLNYIENISNTYNENHELISESRSVVTVIYAADGNVFKNKKNGRLYGTYVVLNSREKIEDYEEVEKED